MFRRSFEGGRILHQRSEHTAHPFGLAYRAVGSLLLGGVSFFERLLRLFRPVARVITERFAHPPERRNVGETNGGFPESNPLLARETPVSATARRKNPLGGGAVNAPS